MIISDKILLNVYDHINEFPVKLPGTFLYNITYKNTAQKLITALYGVVFLL